MRPGGPPPPRFAVLTGGVLLCSLSLCAVAMLSAQTAPASGAARTPASGVATLAQLRQDLQADMASAGVTRAVWAEIMADAQWLNEQSSTPPVRTARRGGHDGPPGRMN